VGTGFDRDAAVMAADFGIVDDNVIRNITTQRDDIFVEFVDLIWLRPATHNQSEAAAALHNAASWSCG
jgi:hypothetical protein